MSMWFHFAEGIPRSHGEALGLSVGGISASVPFTVGYMLTYVYPGSHRLTMAHAHQAGLRVHTLHFDCCNHSEDMFMDPTAMPSGMFKLTTHSPIVPALRRSHRERSLGSDDDVTPLGIPSVDLGTLQCAFVVYFSGGALPTLSSLLSGRGDASIATERP
ncbi:hypothetical protein PLICRDRAFT_44871 [Plicaturopsis crispa FD-325 SS-3]|nr:hypothetical protein PLICRDRAFT_44871 [Plicaturopsis crispa FD-325 SS-3]